MTTLNIGQSGTWTVPAGVYYVDIAMKGGGAGGNTNNSGIGGYGGGEGGVATYNKVAVTPGAGVNVVFPAGGLGHNANAGDVGTGATFGGYTVAGGSPGAVAPLLGGNGAKGAGITGGAGGYYSVTGTGTPGQPGTNGCGGGGGGASGAGYSSTGGNGGDGYLTITYYLPAADFSSASTSGSKPFNAVFTNSSTGGGGTLSYHWTYGDTNTYNGTQETHQYANAGVYTVSLRATGPYGEDTETKTSYITVTSTTMCFGFFIMSDRMRAI